MRKKDIPALTMSGGTLKSPKDIKELRVWIHPNKGEDFYYSGKNLMKLASLVSKRTGKKDFIEAPLAVIWNKKHRKYREVTIPRKLMKVI